MKTFLAIFLAISAVAGAQVIQPGSGSGTVTSIATTSPIGGGTINTTGTLTCTTCATSSTGGRYSVVIPFGAAGVISPANGTTYYIGLGANSPSVSNTTVVTVVSPIACTITAVSYSTLVTGTKDSAANNVTFKVYDLTTSTAFADTAGTLTFQTNNQHSTTVTGASDAVSVGDQLLIQIVTPTFTTPPVNTYYNAIVFCQP